MTDHQHELYSTFGQITEVFVVGTKLYVPSMSGIVLCYLDVGEFALEYSLK